MEPIFIANPLDDHAQQLADAHHAIVSCEQCPRLRAYCTRVAAEKKRAYRDDVYWGRPVPGFGDPQARVLVLGLAPAAHGANRTGRVFTGDGSGDFLMRAMHAAGFANITTSQRADDGLTLQDAYIVAAVRCAPRAARPPPHPPAPTPRPSRPSPTPPRPRPRRPPATPPDQPPRPAGARGPPRPRAGGGGPPPAAPARRTGSRTHFLPLVFF